MNIVPAVVISRCRSKTDPRLLVAWVLGLGLKANRNPADSDWAYKSRRSCHEAWVVFGAFLKGAILMSRREARGIWRLPSFN